MAVYEYRGYDTAGKEVRGIVDADNPRLARQKLRRQGVFPRTVTEEAAPTARAVEGGEFSLSWFTRIKAQEISLLTRQMATLLKAGIPLVETFTALIDQTENVALKKILTRVRETVNEGGSLADGLRPFPRVFSNLYVNMIAAGESSGALDLVLVRLADYLEEMSRLRGKVWSTLAYPLVIMGLGCLVLIFMITFVVPKITKMFADMGQALPLPTQIMIQISSILGHYWWLILLLAAGAIALLRWYIRTPQGRKVFDRALLKAVIIGRIVQLMAISRFTKTLSTLLNSGVPLMKALDIVENIVGNEVLKQAVAECRERVGEGESIAAPLRQTGVFPPLVTHMIAVGEKSGELEGMLQKVSEAYDNEVENSLSMITSLLGPLFIIFIGLIVLFIALSVLLPLFQMNQLVR